MLRSTLRLAIAFAAAASGWGLSVPSPQRAQAAPAVPVRLLYQNDGAVALGAGYLFLPTPVSSAGAADACARFSESLAVASTGKSKAVDSGLQAQIDYLLLSGEARTGDSWWITKRQVLLIERPGKASIRTAPQDSPRGVLCSNTAPRTSGNATDSSERWQVSGQGADASWTGYRDRFSFRFHAVPYASAERFGYATPLSDRGVVAALGKGRALQCPQTAGTTSPYAEECLVANIFTPYLPGTAMTGALKPIMVWLHGGGFSSGSGLDVTFDGGALSSRSDVVVVSTNYRLGSLGFLPVDSSARGNYAISDILALLQWLQTNGPSFGGDPSRVTIFGQSAGAQLVTALLSAPRAAGLFHRAIVQSGRPSDRQNELATSEAARGAADAVIRALGCGSASDKLACLRSLPVQDFVRKSPTFSRPVVDGTYLTTPRLDVTRQLGGTVARVPVIIGFMRDEMASLGQLASPGQSLDEALASAGISSDQRQAVAQQRAIFPTSVRNASFTIQTDVQSIARCGQEATIKAAVQNGIFPSLWAYTQDQRARQIPNYDPWAVCQGDTRNRYYYCHSGDLLPTFASARFAFGLAARDQADVVHEQVMLDSWGAFARQGDPRPTAAYLAARHYSTGAQLSGAGEWQPVTPGRLQLLSLGPVPRMKDLGQMAQQCNALGRDIDYVSRGG